MHESIPLCCIWNMLYKFFFCNLKINQKLDMMASHSQVSLILITYQLVPGSFKLMDTCAKLTEKTFPL